MPPEESIYPQDWFDKAQQDIRTVDILLREQGDAEVAGFHLQQAIEKYLKGFLLANGWSLRRIHNLEVLLNEAVSFATELERFRDLCEKATDFYTLERYPFFSSTGITPQEVRNLRPLLQNMIDVIHDLV
jgi:HEPN domain-containing protein